VSAEKKLRDMGISEAFELLVESASSHERQLEHDIAQVSAGKRSAELLKAKKSKRQEIEKLEELRDMSVLFKEAIDALHWRVRKEFEKERPSL